MPPRIRSIQELRRELAGKEKQLKKAQAQRRKLIARLQTLDKKIVALGGEAVAAGRGPGRPPGKRKAGKSSRGPGRPRKARRATGKPLAEYIKKVLAKSETGMRAKDVVKAVMQAGYKSFSKDFYGIVAAALRDTEGIKKIKRGVYAIK